NWTLKPLDGLSDRRTSEKPLAVQSSNGAGTAVRARLDCAARTPGIPLESEVLWGSTGPIGHTDAWAREGIIRLDTSIGEGSSPRQSGHFLWAGSSAVHGTFGTTWPLPSISLIFAVCMSELTPTISNTPSCSALRTRSPFFGAIAFVAVAIFPSIALQLFQICFQAAVRRASASHRPQ